MPTNTQTQSSDEKKTYTEMPPIEEFRDLDAETQKELINKFPPTQDQEEEKSAPSTTDEDSSTEEKPNQTDDKVESDKTDDQQKDTKKDEPDLVKNYKELQAEFTRRSQRMKEMERELAEIKSKVNKSQDSEQKSPLDELVEKNPQAKDLIDAMKREIETKLGKGLEQGIKPIQEKLTRQTAEENYGKFQSEVKEFLGSPLGKLENEFNQVAAELYENQDALLEAASKDPALFQNIKDKVLSRHFVKAAKLMGEVVSQEEKNSRVKDTGISGKSKTTTTVDDELDMKIFKGKSSSEMKKILEKHGAVKTE